MWWLGLYSYLCALYAWGHGFNSQCSDRKGGYYTQKRCNTYSKIRHQRNTWKLNKTVSPNRVIEPNLYCWTIFSHLTLEGNLLRTGLHCNLSQKIIPSLKSTISRDFICLPDKRTKNWNSPGDSSRSQRLATSMLHTKLKLVVETWNVADPDPKCLGLSIFHLLNSHHCPLCFT